MTRKKVINELIEKFYVINTIDENFPMITVVCVLFNEERLVRSLGKCLEQIDYPDKKLKIILVDDNSDDNTFKYLQNLPENFEISRNPIHIKGKPATINNLTDKIISDWFVIIDADSMPQKDFLKKIVLQIDEPKAGIVQGKNIEYNSNESIISKLVSFDNDVTHNTLHLPKTAGGFGIYEGRGAAINLGLFKLLGGFDCNLPTEDLDYGFRLQLAGYKIYYNPVAICFEQAAFSIKGYYRQRYRWLSSSTETLLKNFKQVLNSNKIDNLKKIDAIVIYLFHIWALLFNFTIAMSIFQEVPSFYSLFYGYNLLLLCFIYTIATVINEKKFNYLLYYPLMIIFYASFTVIISLILIDKLFNNKLRYAKTDHNSSKYVEHFNV